MICAKQASGKLISLSNVYLGNKRHILKTRVKAPAHKISKSCAFAERQMLRGFRYVYGALRSSAEYAKPKF